MIRYRDYCIVWTSCNGDKSRIRKEDYVNMITKPHTKWRYDADKQAIFGKSDSATFDTSIFTLEDNPKYWNWMFLKLVEIIPYIKRKGE